MRLCGVKITHDAAVAVVDGGRLLFSWELEKLGNASRHVRMHRLREITDVLTANDVDPASIDAWSVDGWGDDARPTRLRLTETDETVEVAGYVDSDEVHALRAPGVSGVLALPGFAPVDYVSWAHAVNHAMCAYSTSPFAGRHESALILVWDGGMPPTLYHYDPATARLRRRGSAGPWFGNLYPDFISYFTPFTQHRVCDPGGIPYQLALPGTAMAYAALGRVDSRTYECLALLLQQGGYGRDAGDDLARRFLDQSIDVADVDVIATFQFVVGELLASRVGEFVRMHDLPRLCLAGGCALNIGWNTAIRDTAGAEVWIPPFPNDSGSAIGAAASALAAHGLPTALDWDVFSGPPVLESRPLPGWSARSCSAEGLGRLLATGDRPVVVLSGAAELGPRALGNRSILAPPWFGMNERLNKIKGREAFRPVAPICLEDRAPEIFDPGHPDPYMLFVHGIRDDWIGRIPAVRHIDGTARLQTVNQEQNPTVFRILRAFAELTSIPVLCNTSANSQGSGFFPDSASAMAWGGIHHVWCDGTLYTDGA